MSVEIDQLTKVFENQKAVDNISFSATKGNIIGFLGPNGAGKSTTMKMITSLIPPTNGTIKVCGYDVETNSLQTRKKIGYLPENNPLYYDMYVHEYLHFVGSLQSVKNVSSSQVRKMIDLCGLNNEQNKKIGALSKGYKQRVGLAQALINDPEVLILDEPTTGLDPNQIIEIRKLIKSVSSNKTVLFSTHIMQEVQALCDRVIIINKGKIVADDIPDNLKNMRNEVSIISVEFKEKVHIVDLEKIEGVLEVKQADKTLIIESSAEKDVRPAIFKYATDNNLTLIKLNQEDRSMEDVFRQLTQNKQ